MTRILTRRTVTLFMCSPILIAAGVLLGTGIVNGHVFLMDLIMSAAPEGFMGQ